MRKSINPALPHDIGGQLLLRCCMCNKQVKGFYGRNAVGGTCTGACSTRFDNLPIERKHEMICGHCKKDINLWEDAHSVRGPEGVVFVHTECLDGRTPFKSLPPIADKPEVRHEQHVSHR